MSEFRRNPFTGEWTVYASNRENKPYEFRWGQKKETGTENCPFCPGHEGNTTPVLYEKMVDGKWQIRVFENMFPIVGEGSTHMEMGFYEGVAGIGRHEVVVDTPNHEETIDRFSLERLGWVLETLRLRYQDMEKEKNTCHVQVFKNCGASAGMSIHHSHWQIVSIPIQSARIQRIAEHSMKEGCLFCRMMKWEKEKGIRIAEENNSFLAVTPYASRYAYEVWILPKVHKSTFTALTEEEMADFAQMLHCILPKIAALREDIGYNLCFMDGSKGMDFHWHLQILPRIGGVAGFEHATDCYINTVLPETAAAYYKEENRIEKKSR